MKRIISVLVAALMIFGVFAGNINGNTASAIASPENQHATFLAVRWHAVGNDKFGDPLEGGKSFPWQNPGEPQSAYWGRTGYGMPNGLTAVNRDGTARPVTSSNSRLGTSPMLWTEIFLTVVADNGKSKFITNEGGDFVNLGRWYAIMDTAGQVWFDPDGNFHDSRYLATADPASPSYIYQTGTTDRYETDVVPYGSCLYNPLAKVDPFEGNNTQGPYAFSPKDSDGNDNINYIEPCYFWVRPTLTNEINSVEGNNTCNAYLNHTLKGESRVWQLGIASRPDYYAMGRTSPLGNTFDGVVRTGEWDVGLNVYAFDINEVWVDAPLDIPWGPGGGSGTFTPGDFVYRDLTPGPMTVDPNDVRLTNIVVGIPPNTTMYIAGTVVQPGDLDVGVTINNFPANFRYAKKDLSKTKTTYPIQARAQHGGVGWSDITAAGTSFVPVADVSKFSIGTNIRIGPNNLGQFQQCRVTGIVNTPATAYWQYVWTINPGWYGPQTGWWYYTWGCTGTFAANDYAWIGSQEIARITNVWYNVYLWGWWGPYNVLQFNNNNPWNPWWPNNQLGNRNPIWSTWNQNARKIQKGLELNCELQYDFATGTFVEAIGYNPGDFIYYQNPVGNNVVEGNIRYTDIDGHQIAGYKMGQGAWEDDALVMAEVFFADPNDPRYQKIIKNSEWGRADANAPITASTNAPLDTAYGQCMPTYDLSVECDFWQGERVWELNPISQQWENKWKGIDPAATAVALRSPNPDVQPQHERIAKSTVLDKSGQEFFVHTTTIHNVTPDYREYLGLEIFLDNGFDNSLNTNPANLNPTPLDLHDNYIRGSVCEPYLGATDRGIDLDFNRPLTVLAGSTDNPKFFDMDGGFVYGCNEPIYYDIDNSDTVTVNDIRATPINSLTGPNNTAIPITYLSGSKVTQGDSDIGRILTQFGPNIKYFDSYHPISRLPSGKYDYGESIYYDIPEPPTYPTGNGYVNASDMRYSEVKIGPVVYHCGERVGIGDAFTFQYPVYMLSLGKNGDYNYMDFPVLPFPTMDVDIQIDKNLKVEQTSKISVSVNPPPKPGESIFISIKDTKLEPRLPTLERMIYQADGGQPDNWLEPGSAYTCDGTIAATAYDHPFNGGYYPYYYFGNGYNHYATLPWAFKFYGIDYTVVNVQITGTIGFGNGANHYNIMANPYNYYETYNYGFYGDCALRLNSTGAPRATALGYFWHLNECCWGDGIWPATGETIFIVTWKGSYGPNMYFSEYPPFPEDLVCQMILFSDGRILMQYKKTNCPPYFYGQWAVPGATTYEVGISNGDGINFTSFGDNGACGWGAEGNVMFTPTVIPARPGVPALNVGEDMKFINPNNLTANFEFTPYRGTCLEDGTRAPVEINVYRDAGGYDEPVPRNPPPKTFMAYREPSYSIMAPNWNGKVIAVQSVFGYLPGDWILVGNSYNVERRQITEVHVGDEGANTVQSYHSYPSSTNLLSKIVPVESVTGFSVGHTVIIGDNVERHSPTGPFIQETHIIANVYEVPNPPAQYARLTSQANIGTNVSFNVDNAANYNVGDYVGFGSTNNWWDQNPKRGVETARIISINGNSITVDVLHRTIPTNYYIHQVNAIETRDPIKFDHYGPGDEPAGSNRANKGCPVFNTRFSFTLDHGLSYDHGFGEPVVGVLYFDPYYITNKWSRFDLDMYPVRSFADLLPADIMSPDLDNGYDCFFRGRYNVDPEDIDIELYRKCLKVGQLEQRFPNVLLKLWDADNPNDVNDPANIPISCPAGVTGVDQTIIANVNASGAGVAYLMTCDGFEIANPPPLGPVTHRFIVQVNVDGSYDWWRWYEPASATQIIDALDPNDWLYRWLDDDPDNVIYPPIRTSIPQNDQQYGTMIIDNDCSIGGGICDPVNKDKLWPCLGDVTDNDAYGRFNGVVQDWASAYPNPNNLPAPPYAYGRINHFGVPCAIERWDSSQQRNMQTDGGQIMFPLVPKKAGRITVRVYTYNAIFNYNVASIVGSDEKVSGTPNPGPYFWEDQGLGIDYVGYKEIEVTPADADVNFIEMTMVDHALQNSELNYTAGVSPIYPMKPPAPRIAKDYDPIIRDWKRQVRSYPGGQTYPGILTGNTKGFGWNAYPAIWTKQFVKMGTEFYPLADYGLYFILADGTGNHIGVGIPQTPAPANYKDMNQEPELCFDKIRITGPFMTPMYWNPANLNCIIGTRTTPSYEYNNIKGLPIAYDYSGEIEANNNNYPAYFSFFGGDFSNRWNPLSVDAYTYTKANTWLRKWRDLYYGGFWSVNQTYPNPNHQAGAPAASPNPVEDQQSAIWVFDGIIPISSGEINIEVSLMNGVKKTYEDCCESAVSGRLRNIPVHGLKIDGAPISVTVDTDNVFDLTVTEDTGVDILDNHEWKNKECNDALVFAWQDKGVIDPSSNLMMGTLDGWITLPPQSSATTKVEHAYPKAVDANGDGKISYRDDETEILGSYDLATNTWLGGFVDARTYQRNDGKYKLALTADNYAQIKTVGVDIAGLDANGRPLPRNVTDHIIDSTEETPIIITAYKYGDDNQDRGFTPLYDQESKYDFSHEVYLAGQTQIPIDAVRNLNVTFSPEPLTAGIVSELMSNGDPLSFTVTDYDGNAVDLSIGVPDANGNRQVIDRSVWYYLFVDPHPDDYLYYGKDAVLPQYYWMRTDLHNQETRAGNYGYNNYNYFRSWNPIEFYPNYTEGKYSFKGFVANDKGEFEVYIYTPDRKRSGVVKVKVANPKVEYTIRNWEAKENIFSTPGTAGDPDFILTGNDNRMYEITVTCSNAQDALLKGVARSVSVCSGEGRDIARFTPAITVPRNYYANINYPVYMGIDLNGDGQFTQISATQIEYTSFGTFGGYPYNIYNRRFTDGSYGGTDGWMPVIWYPGFQSYTFPYGWGLSDFLSAPRLFGLNAIYNGLYDGTYYFADITPDGRLNFRDSLSLDENGRTTFFLFATDAFNLTGLVGYNEYTNTQYAASAININSFRGRPFGPNYIRYRYMAGSPTVPYYMNWEAWPNKQLECQTPKIKVLDPVTEEDWQTSIYDSKAYDLVYGIRNHLLVRAYPADTRDTPIHEDAVIGYNSFDPTASQFIIPQHERSVYGRFTKGKDDPNVRETNVFVEPTATGKIVSGLSFHEIYNNSRGAQSMPWWQTVYGITIFDVVKGMEIIPEVPENLKTGRETSLTIKVVIAGESKEPVEGAKVTIGGIVAEQNGTTNAKGEVTFKVKPTDAGRIKITATHDVYGKSSYQLGVDIEVAPPLLIVDPIPSYTNKDSITVKGTTTPGSTVKIGGKPATVDKDGKFSAQVSLTEGLNQFDVDSYNPTGLSTSLTLSIVRDTVAPEIIVDQKDPGVKLIASNGQILLTGRVEPYSTVKVGGANAMVVYDIWTAVVTVTATGEMNIEVEAVDPAGNTTKKTFSITVWNQDILDVSVNGVNMTINGNPVSSLPRSVKLTNGVVMVPVELFTTLFKEAAPTIDSTAKSASFRIAGKDVVVKNGSKDVLYGTETLTIGNAVTEDLGVYYLDASSFSKMFGVEFDYNQATGTVKITRLYK